MRKIDMNRNHVALVAELVLKEGLIALRNKLGVSKVKVVNTAYNYEEIRDMATEFFDEVHDTFLDTEN